MLPCGTEAVLVECDDLDEVQACYATLAGDPPTGVTDLVPAARTVLVAFDSTRTSTSAVRDAVRDAIRDAIRDAVRRARRPSTVVGAGVPARLVEVPVRYDGPDLADVARQAGFGEAEVVRRHTAGEHRVAFCGFAPGFAYVAGLDPALRVPRRAEPRTRVPGGSVAVAGEYSGIYPTSSPGGWNVIGSTDLLTFDLTRDPPFALPPGTRVRFVDVSAAGAAARS